MPSSIDKNGFPARPLTNLPQSAPADTSLSAAFRHVLGSKAGESPLTPSNTKRSAQMKKLAKSEKPGLPTKGASRKSHIGPRSGHK